MSSIEFSTTLMGPSAATSRNEARAEVRQPADRPAGLGFGCRVPRAIGRLNYRLGQLIGRSVFFITMNVRTLRPEAAEREGGYVLACTHLSHLDPLCVGVLVRRKVDWMARLEFFRYRLVAAYLWSVDAFPVNRFGVTARAVRMAINRAAGGRVVGIFPEGGVMTGAGSVCRGGSIKRGACVVARRANVPIIPCVILGTHELNRPLPWIPFRRGNLAVAFGPPIEPKAGMPRRQARVEMAEELRTRFAELYDELREACGIDDAEVP